jgi:hypothetical protein
MRHFLTISVVLLLGTSCPSKSVTLQVVPSTDMAGAEDPRAGATAFLERISQRHSFTPSVSLNGLKCTKTWRRPISSRAPRDDAILCADYTLTGPIVVQLYDVVLMNQKWSPATDSLRRELIDSLGRWGTLTVRDR